MEVDAAVQQFFVRAVLDDAAALHQRNLVCASRECARIQHTRWARWYHEAQRWALVYDGDPAQVLIQPLAGMLFSAASTQHQV